MELVIIIINICIWQKNNRKYHIDEYETVLDAMENLTKVIRFYL